MRSLRNISNNSKEIQVVSFRILEAREGGLQSPSKQVDRWRLGGFNGQNCGHKRGCRPTVTVRQNGTNGKGGYIDDMRIDKT